MNKQSPWFKMYDPGVPEQLIYPNIPIPGFLEKSARLYSQKDALIEGDQHISYRTLLNQSEQFALKLIEWGLQPEDRVGLCLPNSIDFVISYYAILMAGGVVAAINPTYPLREMEFQVGVAKPTFFIGSNKNSEIILQLHAKFEFKRLILTGKVEDYRQNNELTTLVDFNKPFEYTSGILPVINHNRPAVLQFSGGTTGLPKAVVGLHKNIVANVVQFSTWLTPLQPGVEIFLTVIPLFHVYGMVIGLNVGIAMGATIVLLPDPRNIELILHTANRERVTCFPGVPSIYHAINQNYATIDSPVDLTSIKACISGSAPLLSKIKNDFEKITGGRLVEGYGLSEAPTATHCNPLQNLDRPGSIGLPLPDVECRIASFEDSNTDMGLGDEGELLIRGPQIMSGYFEQEEETNVTLKGGWLHTGDIARMDEDGFFYIVGRKKELIKVGGLQVWPVEVENVIYQIPGIRECAVTGEPNEALGEIVKLWVVLENSVQVDPQTIREFCKDKIAGYKIPRDIQILSALPRSSVGKVLKYKLGN
jgi:long-chain acyl-CoA synthetase